MPQVGIDCGSIVAAVLQLARVSGHQRNIAYNADRRIVDPGEERGVLRRAPFGG